MIVMEVSDKFPILMEVLNKLKELALGIIQYFFRYN